MKKHHGLGSTDLVGPVLPLAPFTDSKLKDGLVLLGVGQVQRRAVVLQTGTEGRSQSSHPIRLPGTNDGLQNDATDQSEVRVLTHTP